VISQPGSPWTVFAADLDGDGDVDPISGSFDDNTVAWYANDGGSVRRCPQKSKNLGLFFSGAICFEEFLVVVVVGSSSLRKHVVRLIHLFIHS